MYVIRKLSPRTGLPLDYFASNGWHYGRCINYATRHEAELVQQVIRMYEPDTETTIIGPPPGDDS